MSTTGFDQAYLHLVQIQTQIAARMLYVTGGLLVVALIQALTAVWQGVSARKQALIASEQARIAANTLMASLRTADNATMPLITIGWNEAGSAAGKTLVIRNGGLGPAKNIFLAPLSSKTGGVTEESKEIFQAPLGAGESFDYEVSVKWLQGSGVIFHYESSHGNVLEKLVTANGDILKVKDFRIERPCGDLLL
jgi:hypothetical protein